MSEVPSSDTPGSKKQEYNIRLSYGFIISLLAHMLLLALLIWLSRDMRHRERAINITKISLDLNRIQTLPPKAGARSPKSTPKPRPPIKPAPPIQKRSDPKKTNSQKETPPPRKSEKFKVAQGSDKKELLDTRSKITAQPKENNNSTAIQKKTSPKTQKNRMVEKKKIPQKQNKKITKTLKAQKARNTKRRSAKGKYRPSKRNRGIINSLYGSSYSRMSSAQRKFIDENLRKIMIISQRTLNYLGYPRTAVRMGQQGTNIVQFWLHPNGDISGLRLRRRIGSEALDRQTIEVIKTAYMNYPRPRTKTKIIIYVKYRLY